MNLRAHDPPETDIVHGDWCQGTPCSYCDACSEPHPGLWDDTEPAEIRPDHQGMPACGTCRGEHP